MFNTYLVEPLYNILILILDYLPFANANLAISVIILTIFVRALLFPVSRNAIKSQIKMKEVQPKIKEVQEKYKDDRQQLAMETMKIYRENEIKPFSSFLMILIQLPIIFALYFVFLRNGLPEINPDILYSFVEVPGPLNTTFLWFIDITQKSILLALAAAASQFVQAKIMMSKNNALKMNNDSQDDKAKMMDDVMKGMQLQMKYIMPIFMYFIAYSLGAVLALYFTTSNLFSIFQELYIKKTLIDKKEE